MINWIQEPVGVGQQPAPQREPLADRVKSWKPEFTVRVEPGPIALVAIAAVIGTVIWYGMRR